jgi:glycosyltransferase involved in cell wall biosynthesis
MLHAEHAAGFDSHLLCYCDGLGHTDVAVKVHRVGRTMRPATPGARAFRSGPSARKLLLDAALVPGVRRVAKGLRADLIIAHHVEAAAACALAAVPFTYCAHTSVEAELPTYYPGFPQPLFARVGHALDALSLRAARSTFAVSPLLADMLTRAHGQRVQCVPLPWPLPERQLAEVAVEARRALALPEAAHVALYAGNLDGYQGLHPMLAGMSMAASACESLRLVIATASGRDEVDRLLRAFPGLRGRVLHVPLAGEPVRRMLHAAASVVLVPRSAPGGLPVKLLDALSRGCPVVAAQTARAGFDVAQICRLVPDACAASWAQAVRAAPVGDDPLRRAWIAHNFGAKRYTTALCTYAHRVHSRG